MRCISYGCNKCADGDAFLCNQCVRPIQNLWVEGRAVIIECQDHEKATYICELLSDSLGRGPVLARSE